MNGKLTMGENIGDLSGINIALKAYHISLGGTPRRCWTASPATSASSSPTARSGAALIATARCASRFSPTRTARRISASIGATRNTDGWYDAFGVKSGDKYYLPPDQRVHIW